MNWIQLGCLFDVKSSSHHLGKIGNLQITQLSTFQRHLERPLDEPVRLQDLNARDGPLKVWSPAENVGFHAEALGKDDGFSMVLFHSYYNSFYKYTG